MTRKAVEARKSVKASSAGPFSSPLQVRTVGSPALSRMSSQADDDGQLGRDNADARMPELDDQELKDADAAMQAAALEALGEEKTA